MTIHTQLTSDYLSTVSRQMILSHWDLALQERIFNTAFNVRILPPMLIDYLIALGVRKFISNEIKDNILGTLEPWKSDVEFLESFDGRILSINDCSLSEFDYEIFCDLHNSQNTAIYSRKKNLIKEHSIESEFSSEEMSLVYISLRMVSLVQNLLGSEEK